MAAFFAELKRRNVIRIAIFYGAAAWLILQVSDVLLEIVDAPDGSLRAIATVLLLGAPFALILAWAFEITPEGIKRERDVDRSAETQVRANRKLDVATIMLLTLAIGLLAWFNLGTREGPIPAGAAQHVAAGAQPGPRDLSIAVLPFVNMSVEPENEYFSDGLSEELLNVLARIEDFRVAGRTSSFAFKGQSKDLRAIGEQLQVAHLLDGSVRRQGDRVRITAQLIDARSGYHLWSETYDRRVDDIFAIQDEIATEVVRALRQTLLATDAEVIRQTAKGDVDAYNHYLRGQFHVRLRTRAGLERALEEFNHAIVIDPSYSPPYAGIAMVYALLDNYGYRSLADTAAHAHRALDRALALDPQSDEAWAVRGMLLGQGADAHQRRADSRAALERAIEINPNNAFAHLWLANHLAPDFAAGSAALRRAYEIDPLSPVIIYRRAMEAMQERDEAGLARFLGELEELAPDWFMTWHAMGTAALERGRVADAALAMERAVALNSEYPVSVLMLALTLDMLGHESRALSLLVEAAERIGGIELELGLAAAQARAALRHGDVQGALAVYRAAVEPVPGRHGQAQAELALLETRAGHAADAERRVRTAVGVPAGAQPVLSDPDMLLDYIALLDALVAQGRQREADGIAAVIQGHLVRLADQGFRSSATPLAEGLVDYLTGHPGRLEPALRAAIDQGFRAPPVFLAWVLPLELGSRELDELMAMMDAVLQAERKRYDSARRAETNPTDVSDRRRSPAADRDTTARAVPPNPARRSGTGSG